jgi:hypothetical protein
VIRSSFIRSLLSYPRRGQFEFFFAEVKSATDKLGKSQQRWLRDSRERLHFPFKLIEVRKMELETVAGA